MIYDLQKASILKRISAWLLDFILLCTVIVGAASLISGIVNYDSYSDRLDEYYASYEAQYGVVFDISEEEFYAMSQEERDNYNAAYAALIADKDAMYNYNMMLTLSMMIVSLSILLGYLVLEFLVPLLIGNGQTVGKKVFGIAVMRTNGVKINGVCLFIRTVLGKYTLETMIPVLVFMMLLFNVADLPWLLLVFAIVVAQVVLLIVTPTNSLIHDKLADTVTVDMASQMIFDTEEELLEYKKRVSAENAEKQPYF